MIISMLQYFCCLGDCWTPAFAGALAAVTTPWLNGDRTGTRTVNQEERLSNGNRLAQHSPCLGTQQ